MPDLTVVTPAAAVPADRLTLAITEARGTGATTSAFCNPDHVAGACYCVAEA